MMKNPLSHTCHSRYCKCSEYAAEDARSSRSWWHSQSLVIWRDGELKNGERAQGQKAQSRVL